MKRMPGGMPNMGNMNAMLKQAQKMQQTMMEAQEAIANAEFDVAAGGGAVNIKINGKKQILELKISPEIVDPDDIETLCDIVMAGVNEAIRKVDEFSEEKMNAATGGMSMPGLF